MRPLLALLPLLGIALLFACGDDVPIVREDAAVDAPADVAYAPPINWDEFGEPCERDLWGPVTCRGTEGSAGFCILDGPIDAIPPKPYSAHCQPICRLGFYMHECPPDGIAVFDGYKSQGCHCERRK